MTGDFTEAGLLDDVEDLNPWELRSIADWQLFYEKEYTYLGKCFGVGTVRELSSLWRFTLIFS